MKKSFTCTHGHHWEVALDAPLAVACMSCPECGAAAETLPPQDSSVVSKTGRRPPSLQSAEATIGLPASHAGQEERTTTLPKELADHPRYQVVEVIGKGGMGSVFKAEHRVMKRQVALKLIRPSLLEQFDAVERFRREIRVAASLAHPNIVMAYDAEQAGGLNFLAMEYVEGITLAHLVEKQGPLPAVEACGYIIQALAGLEHACGRGMVHRDLKPHNLMRTPEGVVKILDFGLARFVRECLPEGPQTHTGMVMGTADYIAPEQATRPHQADVRADLYSLGCTLYFLLTGRPPFATGSVVEKLLWHQQKAPPSVERLRPDLPAGLSAVLRKLMAKRPEDRYQTPAQAAKALAPFAKPGREVRTWRPRWPWLVGAAGLLLAIVLAVATIRVVTDFGEIEIKTADQEVQIVILKDGNEIDIIDLKSRRQFQLRSGEYELKLKGDAGDLTLSTDRLKLRRGDKTIVEIRPIAVAKVVSDPKDAKSIPAPVPDIVPLPDHAGLLRCLAISPSGKQFLSGGRPDASNKIGDNDVRLWNLEKPEVVARMHGHTDTVESVAFTPDGKHALSSGRDFRMFLWRLGSRTEQPQSVAMKNTFARVGRMAVSKKDKVITSAKAGKVNFWALPDLRVLDTVDAPDTTWAVAFSPDGERALAAGGMMQWNSGRPLDSADYRVWLYDANDHKVIHQFKGHTLTVWSVIFSRDGAHILSASADRTIRLWSIAEKNEKAKLVGHTAGVTCLAFSPDGKKILSGGMDRTVRLWDLQTGAELARLSDVVGIVYAVAYTPDGRRALIAGETGLRLWNLPKE